MSDCADALIIGAGIGGLTAGIALARAGWRVRVFEQSAELREVGAGVTLASGAMRSLEMLGLDAAVRDRSQSASQYEFRHYLTGATLRRGFEPQRRAAAARDEWQLHRADLQDVLVRALEGQSPGALTLNHRLVDFTSDELGVVAQFANGVQVRGRVLVAADGVRSLAREHIAGGGALRFMGQVAYRCLVPMPRAREVLAYPDRCVYVGPGRTFNQYPVRGSSLINCVGIVQSEQWTSDGWTTPASVQEFQAAFHGWHPLILALIGRAAPEAIIKWALIARDPLHQWRLGRAVLLGDAAHPMLPFLGTGAMLAIEDAVVLARALTVYPDARVALARYEAARMPRTTQMFHLAVQQGQMVQGADPDGYRTSHAPAHDPSVFDYDASAVAV